jgi:serine protease Do
MWKLNWLLVLAATCLFASRALAEVPDDDPRVTPVVRAYRKARPAVVNISAEKTVSVSPFGNDPLEDVFPSPFTHNVKVQSLGSGIVISPAGYIVTNAHVVRKAREVTVSTPDGGKFEAKIISADPEHDMAILKIEAKDAKPLPYLALGRSDDLMVGETVIAVGNPLGYSNSVTTGVVSAVGRKLDFGNGVEYKDLIQTDAPINPGNSGGALLNIKGELVGITSAIRSDAQNIGFAIAVDTLAGHFCRLLDVERINRVSFGADVCSRHGAKGEEVFVSGVRKDTPAYDKLHAGDKLLAVNDQPVRQITEYAVAMLAMHGGQSVRIKALRDGNAVDVEITLGEKPRPDGKALGVAMLGLTLKPLTRELAGDLNLSVEHGLLVVGVEAGSPADKLGIHLKDVVFQAGAAVVTNLDDLASALEEVAPGQTIKIGVVRGRTATVTEVRVRAPRTSTQPAKADSQPKS